MTQLDIQIQNEYFDWLCSHIDISDFVNTHKKLLMFLHSFDFSYTIPLDSNRAEDGISLRYRFGNDFEYDPRIISSSIDIKPCSVFEMMVALAFRFEESILNNPEYGDRTGNWFWEMIETLTLFDMDDFNFNKDIVSFKINRFLNREYEPNGLYGLFIVNNPKKDLRTTEIWYQAMWHFNEFYKS